MKITVLDADTFGSDLDLSPLDAYGEVTAYRQTAPEEIAARAAGAEVLVLNKVKLNRDNLNDAAALRLICVFATGFDNIDLPFCRERGIAVCNVVGYSTNCVAQLTVAMALSLTINLGQFRSYVASGEYSASGVANRLTPAYHEIAGKTWGIAGYGNIGKAVGRAAEALGCRVIAFKRTPEPGTETVGLEELCSRADILSVHMPLNDATRGIFSADKIALLKKDAIFINVARGAVADEAALCEAVKQGRIGGLGVDVYSKEPFPKDHPFYEIKDYPNVILTPHMAWGGIETRVRCLEEICKNIASFVRGERRNRVD